MGPVLTWHGTSVTAEHPRFKSHSPHNNTNGSLDIYLENAQALTSPTSLSGLLAFLLQSPWNMGNKGVQRVIVYNTPAQYPPRPPCAAPHPPPVGILWELKPVADWESCNLALEPGKG